MSEHLPTVKQINMAEPHLASASRVAITLEACSCSSFTEARRRLVRDYIMQAASALGFDLVPRSPVSLVIDNTNHAEGPR